MERYGKIKDILAKRIEDKISVAIDKDDTELGTLMGVLQQIVQIQDVETKARVAEENMKLIADAQIRQSNH